MPYTLIIEDIPLDSRFSFWISTAEIQQVEEVWSRSDDALRAVLSSVGMTEPVGMLEMPLSYYRQLLLGTLHRFCRLTPEQRTDHTNPITVTLRFLASGMVRSIEHNTDCTIDTLRIVRFADNMAHFNWDSTFSIILPEEGEGSYDSWDPSFASKNTKPIMQVVVDNTKNDKDPDA
jgi:hypothetical protein